jgi:hypothetical protein
LNFELTRFHSSCKVVSPSPCPVAGRSSLAECLCLPCIYTGHLYLHSEYVMLWWQDINLNAASKINKKKRRPPSMEHYLWNTFKQAMCQRQAPEFCDFISSQPWNHNQQRHSLFCFCVSTPATNLYETQTSSKLQLQRLDTSHKKFLPQ